MEGRRHGVQNLPRHARNKTIGPRGHGPFISHHVIPLSLHKRLGKARPFEWECPLQRSQLFFSLLRAMEASGAVLQRAPMTAGERRLCGRRTRRVLGGGFTDAGTMKYYVSCGAKKKAEKNRAKLVKRLEKDLSAFYSMSSVVEPGVGLNKEAESKVISDAANLLLTKLKELTAEEKQMRRRKAEKAKSVNNCSDIESSSSSSSDSSDSECETIVKMSKLKRAGLVNTEPKRTLEGMQQRSMIEVCMGGKCKKSGGLEVMEEFEKKVGIEGAVVGCKCMGKCRDGPNVRLVSHNSKEDDLLKPLRNPLCLGVGLGDVNTIVTNFFGEKDVNLLAA